MCEALLPTLLSRKTIVVVLIKSMRLWNWRRRETIPNNENIVIEIVVEREPEEEFNDVRREKDLD